MDPIMTTMAHGPFYYYSPDANHEARQHGHFIPQHQQMPMYPVIPTLPSTPVYSRPNSSCSQQQQLLMTQPQPLKPFAVVPNMMTPMPSPPAPAAAVVGSNAPRSAVAHQKPTILLETELCDTNGTRYPATPPLSTTSSTISSPGSCDVLVTPLNPMFSGLDSFDGLKEANVSDVASEKFPMAGWASSSPPLTPVYIQAAAQLKTLAPTSGTVPPAALSSDLLSVSACPSLSPSPSPYARSVSSEQDNDFCDPRNLTVSSLDGDLSPEFSAVPSSLSPTGEVEDFILKSESTPSETENTQASIVSCTADFANGLPILEEFPDLESEDDFVNGLVNLGADFSASSVATPDLSRSRASSSASSNSEIEFFDSWESSFDSSDSQHHSKRQRTASGSFPVMATAADATTSTSSSEQPSESHNERSDASNQDQSNTASSGSPGNADNSSMSAAPVPTNRRGRKQSLTEDPSKIFACDLCNRRFRRQEHLKRHYRSLHTQDKPFSCHECGKKFSRSDNLAQHARTHGAGAFVMNLYDDPEIVAAATGGYPPHAMYAPAPHPMPMGEDYSSMGRVLFQVTAEIPGSASELSSDDGSDSQSKKKRKRAD